MELLNNVGLALTRLLTGAANVALMLVGAWVIFKLLLSGGSSHGLAKVGMTLLTLGVAYAALTNLPAFMGIVIALGGAVFSAIAEAVNGSGAGGGV